MAEQDSHVLWERISKIEVGVTGIEDRVERIEQKLDSLMQLGYKLTALEVRAENHTNRLKKLEDNQAKITWFILLAVVGAILNLIFTNK